ncbi:MAG: NAD(P)-dependent oxidoreductase [Pseudomonadota bacterium]
MTSQTPVVVFAGRPEQREAYERDLRAAAGKAGLGMTLVMDPAEADPAAADYLILAPSGPVTDFTPYIRLKAILNLWAGVEQALALPLPPAVPLVRMVEEGLTLGMLDYVTGHVMRHHLDLDRYVGNTTALPWEANAPPLAAERKVTLLGLGALGGICASRLAGLGFQVHGWSRTARHVEGVTCHHGADGLIAALDGASILVLLLPQTPQTVGIVGASALSRLAPGAAVINAGRGPLIDDDALLAALDRGHLGHATLDVFDVEPLPVEHPFWTHPNVTVTPHIASITRSGTASRALVSQIARGEAGQPFLHVVERDRGY